MKLTCTAFADGATIPVRYTNDGADISPPLEWSATPPGTKSLALICDDPDAPHRTWVHWILFNLSADRSELPEGVADDIGQPGMNDFKSLGYGGPSPPKGKPHRYFFKLYALDKTLELPADASKSQVELAMKGHILASAQVMGRYGR